MPDLSPSHTRLLCSLVRLSGRDPDGYAARVDPDQIRVLGPQAAASYPLAGWISLFLRHLHLGYFDRPEPTERARDRAARPSTSLQRSHR